MQEVPLFYSFCEQTLRDHPQLAGPQPSRRLLFEAIRRMLSQQV